MSDQPTMQDLISSLEEELENEKGANRNFRIVGSILLVVVGGYLAFAYSQIRALTDPAGLAEAATGVALTAVPDISQSLRESTVEGAPELARYMTSSAIEVIPAYRGVLEDELYPVIDEVCSILASVAVTSMVESTAAGDLSPAADAAAAQDAANAVVNRIDRVLTDAMDEPMEDHGPTPRQMIERSLRDLEVIDDGLKRVAKGRGPAEETALIMGWLNVLAQFEEEAELSARENYRAQGAPE